MTFQHEELRGALREPHSGINHERRMFGWLVDWWPNWNGLQLWVLLGTSHHSATSNNAWVAKVHGDPTFTLLIDTPCHIVLSELGPGKPRPLVDYETGSYDQYPTDLSARHAFPTLSAALAAAKLIVPPDPTTR